LLATSATAVFTRSAAESPPASEDPALDSLPPPDDSPPDDAPPFVWLAPPLACVEAVPRERLLFRAEPPPLRLAAPRDGAAALAVLFLAAPRVAVDFFAVLFLAVLFFAAPCLAAPREAVDFLAVLFLAAPREAVLFFAVDFLAVLFLAAAPRARVAPEADLRAPPAAPLFFAAGRRADDALFAPARLAGARLVALLPDDDDRFRAPPVVPPEREPPVLLFERPLDRLPLLFALLRDDFVAMCGLLRGGCAANVAIIAHVPQIFSRVVRA
jgi:hypothetical protein